MARFQLSAVRPEKIGQWDFGIASDVSAKAVVMTQARYDADQRLIRAAHALAERLSSVGENCTRFLDAVDRHERSRRRAKPVGD